jgi:hypothetical protein
MWRELSLRIIALNMADKGNKILPYFLNPSSKPFLLTEDASAVRLTI